MTCTREKIIEMAAVVASDRKTEEACVQWDKMTEAQRAQWIEDVGVAVDVYLKILIEDQRVMKRIALALAKQSGINDWFKSWEEFLPDAKAAFQELINITEGK